MTNPCSAFSSGSLRSGEASGRRMSRGSAAGSPSPERRSPDGGASDGSGSGNGDGLGSLRWFSMEGRIPAPVRLDIDTEFQAVRQQEKEDIKVLNNQFVTLIEKVGTAPGGLAVGRGRQALPGSLEATPGTSSQMTQLITPISYSFRALCLRRVRRHPWGRCDRGLCLSPRGALGDPPEQLPVLAPWAGGTGDRRVRLSGWPNSHGQ